MGLSFKELNPDVSEDYITLITASISSGYNEQYLRRLLREGIFKTRKIRMVILKRFMLTPAPADSSTAFTLSDDIVRVEGL
jgi:hypothetical protein